MRRTKNNDTMTPGALSENVNEGAGEQWRRAVNQLTLGQWHEARATRQRLGMSEIGEVRHRGHVAGITWVWDRWRENDWKQPTYTLPSSFAFLETKRPIPRDYWGEYQHAAIRGARWAGLMLEKQGSVVGRIGIELTLATLLQP